MVPVAAPHCSGFFARFSRIAIFSQHGQAEGREPTRNMSTEHTTKSAEFMRRAISLALENIRSGGGPFGAVIAKDGRIVAEGVNRVTANNDPTAHAEIVVIREACCALADFQLAGCDLY